MKRKKTDMKQNNNEPNFYKKLHSYVYVSFAIAVIIFIVASFNSCSHNKYILKHKDEICEITCPDKTITIIKDSIFTITDTIYESVIVEVPLPTDTVIVYRYIRVVDGVIQADTIYATNGLAMAKAWLFDEKLGLMVYNKSSYTVRLDSLKQIIDRQQTIIHSNISSSQTNSVKTVTAWWTWWLVAIAFLIGTFRKSIVKLLLKLFKI